MFYIKILLYFENIKFIKISGIGKVLEHQKKALLSAGINFYINKKNYKNFDIFHINTYGLNSFKIIRIAKKFKKKIIYHAHSNKEDLKNSFIFSNKIVNFLNFYLKKLYNLSDILITPTEYSKKILEKNNIKKPIIVLSNGVDLSQFKFSLLKKKKFNNYFNIKNKKVIISVGLYFERKGILDFVEIAKKMPQYRFIWFGYTPLYLIPNKIKKVLKFHSKNLEFPGYIKGDILEGAYLSADLFFFPSYEETEGIVILEALASKQQILIRDIPVYKKWLKNGKNCYKGSNNLEFLKLIDKLLNMKIKNTINEGYLIAKQRNLNIIGYKLKKIYEKLILK